MDKRAIEILDEKYSDIDTRVTDYKNSFKQTLNQFLKDNKLDGDVIRTENGKEMHGVLRLSSSSGNASIIPSDVVPFIVFFYPHKKDGTISTQHRRDDFIVNAPHDYFNALLNRYKPAE